MQAVQTALLSSLQGDDAVRFASQIRPHAMAWAAVTPAEALRTLVPHVDFQCLVRWHLGAPLLISPGAECPRCDARLDVSGHHLVCCMRNGIVQRHGVVQDAIHRLALRAGLTARKEQAADDGSRPGDVFIPRLDANGPAAVDVTVRHSLAPSRPVRAGTDLDGWFQGQEREKVTKYRSVCARRGWTLVPFVVDCYGGLGKEAGNLVSQFLKLLLGQKEGWARRSAEADVWQALGIALARDVARQLRASCYAFLGEEGVGVDPGLAPARRRGTGGVNGARSHNPYS